MVHNQLKIRGICNEDVINAMLNTRRELFVPENLKNMAYADTPLPIGHSQTISQPYIVARMTQLLNPEKDCTVLEIGTGSGYQAAVLSHIVKRVYTMERIGELRKRASQNIRKHNISNIIIIQGDGTIGLSQYAPFDRIIVTAASPGVPQLLIDQLSNNGIMIIPVGSMSTQVLRRITMHDNEMKQEDFDPCRFVPLIGRNGFDI